jgi:hypothetical protein
LDITTDYSALKAVIDHKEFSGLWLWHRARPLENERQKPSQSWATVTSMKKTLAGERSHLARMPRTRDHESQPAGIRRMSDYTRSVRSDQGGHASVGYVNSVNAPTVVRKCRPRVSTRQPPKSISIMFSDEQ